MSQDEEFDRMDEECRGIANRKHGNLQELTEAKKTSRRMCQLGVLLSPLLIGIPLAWTECKRNAQIKYNLPGLNIAWNETYTKCMARKKREASE